jgi:hypothetical protein
MYAKSLSRDMLTECKIKTPHAKTYDSGDSLVATHLTTNPPVSCLRKDNRTGIPTVI